tara:strand:+ start:499 stop:717 length:219 start_codon:yes stop_codon:yes gene_type:complete
MTTIDFVELELGGDSWKISWDDARRLKVKTVGEKHGLKCTSYYIPNLTPSKAYDVAMQQLEWLKKELTNGDV